MLLQQENNRLRQPAHYYVQLVSKHLLTMLKDINKKGYILQKMNTVQSKPALVVVSSSPNT